MWQRAPQLVRRQLQAELLPQLVAALPEAALRAEADASGEFEARVADATKLIADAREWSLAEAEERLAGNARAFLL